MKILEVNSDCEVLKFYGNAFHCGSDYFLKANSPLESVKYCFFFDSRALSGGWQNSLLQMLLDYFASEHWLAIIRPLNLTIWATFLNFMLLNKIEPELIITNIGLVDFTPKKKSLLQDMLEQVKFSTPGNNINVDEREEYQLSDGVMEKLYTFDYPEQFVEKLKSVLYSYPVLVVKSPTICPEINIKRKRPTSFFTQLNETNKFIDSLGCKTIEPGKFDDNLTYDAVHWTPEGNKFIFNLLVKNL